MTSRWIFRLRQFIGPLILVLTGSYMLKLSWFKWPDLLIDYGRELYVPWQITQGKVLYRDINHLYGPLANYYNAFLFQIFGTGLSTLAYFNIGLVILLCIIIYNLFKSAFGDVIATTAGICFLVLFAFSHYVGMSSFNFVCPYSHEITYGIFLFFLALFIFSKYLTEQKTIYAALIGFILGLIFLTKVEVALAAFASISFGLIFIFRQLKPAHFGKQLLYLASFLLLPIVVFFIYFSTQMPPADAFNAIIASYRNIFTGALVTNVFYLWVSGLDHPLQNMTLMLLFASGYLVFLVVVGFISWLFTRLSKAGLSYGVMVIVFTLVMFVALLWNYPVRWMDIARPYPIFLSLLLIFLTINLFLRREDKPFTIQFLPFTVLTFFSLLLLLKMILYVRFYHYGFALAMPASLVMIALLLYYIPELISRWGNRTVAMSLTGLSIFLTFFFFFSLTKNFYDLKNYPVAQGRDRFYTFDVIIANNGPVINETLKQVDQLMSEKDTFIVLPEGVMINYLTRRCNPSRYFEFTPNIVEAIGEKNIVDEISSARPSFILLSEKDTSEHGARYFGTDYALNISSWIKNNYDKVALIGLEPLTGNGFGIIIAKKKKVQQ